MNTRKVRNAAITAGLCLTMAFGAMPVAAIAKTAQGTALVSTKASEQKTGYLAVSFVDQDGKTIAETEAFENVTIGTKISDL